MSTLELGAVVFSLLSVGFAIRRHILNWPVGIVGVLLYMILFYQVKLYADMVLQIIFTVQAIYGWYNWSKEGNAAHAITVSTLEIAERLMIIIAIISFTWIWAAGLKRYTEASLPYVDAFASTTSFVATWLMARKKLESWILWIVADVVYIGMFWYKGLYLSSGIYFVFLVMAVMGLLRWNRNTIRTASL